MQKGVLKWVGWVGVAKCLEPSTVRKILETKVEIKYFQLLEIYISQLTQVTKVGLSIHLSSNKKHFILYGTSKQCVMVSI